MWFLQNEWCIYGMTDAHDGDAKKLCSPRLVADTSVPTQSWTSGSERGVSGANNLKEKIEKKLNLNFTALFTAQQVHGTKVQVVSVPSPLAGEGAVEENYFPQTDGMLTDLPNIILVVYTADCVPIILKEEKRKVIGILHAGWRGIAAGILKEALSTLKKEWQIEPKQVNFFLGTHIRSCCYQVGKEVAEQFPKETLLQKDGKIYLDLEKVLRNQIQQLGGNLQCVSSEPCCTCCNQNFFSYRRNKTNARMLSFIAKLN